MSMTEVLYRDATPADAPACADLLQDWLEATDWMPDLHGRDATHGWVAGHLFPSTQVIVAQGQAGLVGFVAVDADAQVLQLQVAEGARGQGVGHRLLALARARSAAGLSLWCFAANGAALRFYAREGFREAARTEGDNAEGLPDIHLVQEQAA